MQINHQPMINLIQHQRKKNRQKLLHNNQNLHHDQVQYLELNHQHQHQQNQQRINLLKKFIQVFVLEV